MERVERMFAYDAESWKESNANFLSLFEMQNMIVSFVVSTMLMVGGLGILAIQIMVILQKQRDIGMTRRSLHEPIGKSRLATAVSWPMSDRPDVRAHG